MRVKAGGAVFYSVLPIHKISAAFFAQHVKGAVAEEAVEVAAVSSGVAWEVFALLMAEIGICFILPVVVQRDLSFPFLRMEQLMRGASAESRPPSLLRWPHPACRDLPLSLCSIPPMWGLRRS